MADSMDLLTFKLFDLPDHILPKVFQHLTIADLLSATRICKRIKAIAKEAFELKYNGESNEKFYEVTVRTDNDTEEPKPYWPIFNTFGDNMKAIKLNYSDSSQLPINHWLFRTIRQKCISVNKLEITYTLIDIDFGLATIDIDGIAPIFPTLTHLTLNELKMETSEWARHLYPSLRSFNANRIKGLELEDFNEFITKNPQIQELVLFECVEFTTNILDTLNNTMNELRSLELNLETEYLSSESVKLEKLETLKISIDNLTAVNILSTISNGCKNLQELELVGKWDCEIRGDTVDVICSFERIKKLKIFGKNLDKKLLLILVQRLPDLRSLQICDTNVKIHFENDVLKLFKLGNNLTRLCIHMERDFVSQQWMYLQKFQRSIRSDCFDEFKEIIGDRDAKFIMDDGEQIVVTKEKIIHQKKERARKFVSIDLNKLPEAERKLTEFKGDFLELSVKSIASRDSDPKKPFWNRLMTNYGAKITELHINRVHNNDLTGFNFSLPNLVKLQLAEFKVHDFNIFKSFDCPNLQQLEMYEYCIESSISDEQLNIINHFENLISIKLDQVDDLRKNIFDGMKEASCARIKQITFGNYNDDANELSRLIMINVISQFRNLTELNLISAHFENMNFRHLFENCSKLVKLSLALSSNSNFDNAKRLFECVKENCQQIQVIQLIQRSDPNMEFIDLVEEDHKNRRFEFGRKFLNGIADLFPETTILVVGIDQTLEVVREKRVFKNSRPL